MVAALIIRKLLTNMNMNNGYMSKNARLTKKYMSWSYVSFLKNKLPIYSFSFSLFHLVDLCENFSHIFDNLVTI